MAAEQSEFSKLSKKELAFISEKLIDEDFPTGNPYLGDFESAYNTLQEVSRYFNIQASQEDVEFFAKFLELNGEIISELFANNKEQIRNKNLIEQLVIPFAKSYNLDYDIWGTCTYTEYLTQEFDCYDEDWVTESAEQQRQDGNWDIWGGGTERMPTDYDNFESDDFNFVEVIEVDSNESQNESVLHRLVIENTSDVIKCLDKKTLIKLKSIIESRLRII
jgi:hypothetical protein